MNFFNCFPYFKLFQLKYIYVYLNGLTKIPKCKFCKDIWAYEKNALSKFIVNSIFVLLIDTISIRLKHFGIFEKKSNGI